MDNKGRAVRKRTKILWALIIFHFIFIPTFGFADEADIFTTSVNPDALIAVDWSLSMNWTSAGQFMYTNAGVDPSKCTAAASGYNGPFYPACDASHPVQCDYANYVNVPIYSNPSCSGPFYKNNSVSGYTTDCTRVAIAKRAVFNLLDANA